MSRPTVSNGGGNGNGVSRRSFIQTVGVSAAASAASSIAAEAATADMGERQAPPVAAVSARTIGPDPQPMSFLINGKAFRAEVDPTMTLAEVLRWKLDLTGTKLACERGACGACSVLVDGRLIASCMFMAVDAIGTEISTIEGLAPGDGLDPIQEAFVQHDALQCGFCTPGLIMACKDLLQKNPRPSVAEIRQGLSGNLCRCGTYTNVFNAVLAASGQPVSIDTLPPHAAAAVNEGGLR